MPRRTSRRRQRSLGVVCGRGGGLEEVHGPGAGPARHGELLHDALRDRRRHRLPCPPPGPRRVSCAAAPLRRGRRSWRYRTRDRLRKAGRRQRAGDSGPSGKAPAADGEEGGRGVGACGALEGGGDAGLRDLRRLAEELQRRRPRPVVRLRRRRSRETRGGRGAAAVPERGCRRGAGKRGRRRSRKLGRRECASGHPSRLSTRQNLRAGAAGPGGGPG